MDASHVFYAKRLISILCGAVAWTTFGEGVRRWPRFLSLIIAPRDVSVLLRTCGSKVTRYWQPRTAARLALARKNPPHLVIADAALSTSNDCELVRHLRANRGATQPRVILMADHTFPRELIALAGDGDAAVLLAKTSKPADVIRMVEQALGETPVGGQLMATLRPRKDREPPQPPANSRPPPSTELARMIAENERMRGELRDRGKEVNREVVRGRQAEQKSVEVPRGYPFSLEATSDSQLQSLFASVPEGMLLIDDQGQFVAANPAACQMLGCGQDELLTMSVPDFVGEQAKAADRQLLAAGTLRQSHDLVQE